MTETVACSQDNPTGLVCSGMPMSTRPITSKTILAQLTCNTAGLTLPIHSAVQSQKAVSAYFASKQILTFRYAEQH